MPRFIYEVDAHQFDGSKESAETILEWLALRDASFSQDGTLNVPASDGWARATVGSGIIKDRGKVFVLGKQEFETLYQEKKVT